MTLQPDQLENRQLPMKILHVTLSFSRGGRREAIVSLTRGLAALDVESQLCCINRFDCDADAIASDFHHALELDRRGLLDGSALRRLRGHCRRHGIDIVHCHDAASEFTAALALAFTTTPMLATFHRTLGFESAQRKDRLRNALADLRASAIVVASRERRRHYLERNWVAPGKIVRIPLGIDLARFRPDPAARAAVRTELGLSPGQRLLGAVGHFGPEKGIDVVLNAFQQLALRPGFEDTALLVLGTGSPEQQAQIRAAIAPGLASRIHLQGFQPDSERWFAALDLLLHGARAEAFGLVLVEAMACGVPVVASAVGGIPDIVIDGATGRLVTAANAAALAATAAELLASPAQLTTCGNHAHTRAHAEFDRATCAARHLALYQAIQSHAALPFVDL